MRHATKATWRIGVGLLLACASVACEGAYPLGLGPSQDVPPVALPPWTPASDHAGLPPLCGTTPADFAIWFEDGNLESAVRSALGVDETADLTCDLVAGLTVLDARSAGVVSLEGIQNLTSLVDLNLNDNPGLIDLGPLSALGDLESLRLEWNPLITDLGPLAALTNLEHLALGGFGVTAGTNAYSDLAPLSTLSNLRVLSVRASSVQDLTPLAGLSQLSHLNLSYTFVEDFGPLASLTGLTILLLVGNQIDDIGPLSGLTELVSLWINSNQISDLGPLSGLTHLRRLQIWDNPITDISPLQGLVGLQSLTAVWMQLTDIGALEFLTSLTFVALQGNADLSDIQPLIANVGLGVDDWVSLNGTAVSCADVATLAAKGVTVISDCP